MVMDPLAFLDSIAGHTQAQHPSRTVRLGVIDPAYTVGNPKVTFDGESTLSVKGYPYAGYTPVAGERVVLLPVANTYVIVGALSGTAATGSHNHDHGALTGLADNDHPQYSLSGHTHSTSGDPDVRYYQNFNQTINSSTDTKVQFNSPDYTDVWVTVSGTNNQDFRLDLAGLWRLSASVRLQATGADEVHMFISTGTSAATVANRVVGTTVSVEGTVAPSLSVSTDIRVSAFTSVFVGVYQNSGVSVGTDYMGESNHFALSWIRS